MKFMDRISRLVGRRDEAELEKQLGAVHPAEIPLIEDQRLEKPAELTRSAQLLPVAQEVTASLEGKRFERSVRRNQPYELENRGLLTPSELRMILEGAEASLKFFSTSPRLHTTDTKGDTPLHIAASIGNLVLCDLFVRSGSDPEALNNDGQTPADVALAEGHRLAAQLLYSLVGESPRPEQIQCVPWLPKAEITAAIDEGSSEATFPDSGGSPRLDAVRGAPDRSLNSSWSDERVRRLKTLWAEGRSASQISRELGCVSRNAVLSKLFRLGLSNKPRPDVDSPEDQGIGVTADDLSTPLDELGKGGITAATLEGGSEATSQASGGSRRDYAVRSAPDGSSRSSWSDEQVQRLTTLWSEGRSASQIARELGCVSRNAVLSKLFRLKLLNKPRLSMDSTEDQQRRVASGDLSPPSEKHGQAGLRPFAPADEQRSQNSGANTLDQWHAGTFWTRERTEVLRQMWSNGRSANEIARAFGGVLTPRAVLFELHRLGIHDRHREQTEPVKSALQESLLKEEPSSPVELARDSAISGYSVQIAELEDPLRFEAEVEPEEFFDKTANQTASGKFVAVLNSSPTVLDDEDANWELDLSPAPIAGEGIRASTAVQADHGADSDFLQVGARGRQSVKRAVVQTGTRILIDADLCLTWAEEVLAKGRCSVDDVDRLVADCEGNGELEELRINLQRNLEAAGFDLDPDAGYDANLWDAVPYTSTDDLVELIKAALSRRTRLPGTQRFVMGKSRELQLLEPMIKAKQELQLGILGSEIAVETILEVLDIVRDGSRDPGSVTLRTIIPARLGHSETSEVFTAAEALRSWHTSGRVMDGKRRREALAALETLDLSLTFQKELVRRLGQLLTCQAEASQLENEILGFEAATELLIRKHLPYVRRFASRNVEEGEDPEDVFQVAFMGLQRSTRRFDPELGYRFLIYATYWMRQAITRWRADEGTAIRIPVHRVEKTSKLDRALEKLDVKVGSVVSDLELAEELDWTADEVRQFRSIPREAEYPDCLRDWDKLMLLQPEDDVFDQAEAEWIVAEALADLPERQADVLRMRFGIGREAAMTLEEIGQIYGVTRERIRQIEAKALDRLSHPGRSRRLRNLLGYEGNHRPTDIKSRASEQQPDRHVSDTISEKNQKMPRWTDERVDRLRRLWAAGKNASQIAQEMGDTSRNAVIGKLNRLGLAESDREGRQ